MGPFDEFGFYYNLSFLLITVIVFSILFFSVMDNGEFWTNLYGASIFVPIVIFLIIV